MSRSRQALMDITSFSDGVEITCKACPRTWGFDLLDDESLDAFSARTFDFYLGHLLDSHGNELPADVRAQLQQKRGR